MKLEQITFIPKRCSYNTTKKGVVVSRAKNTKLNSDNIQISFYNQEYAIENHNYCFIGHVENRIYFVFNDFDDAYKLIEMHKGYRNALKTVISGDKAAPLRNFVRIEYYDLLFDNECKLHYIENKEV
jgi:hypothetical protein